MAGERKFIRESTNRILIKEFLIKKVEGAGFGGMTIQRTPMGTRINIIVSDQGWSLEKVAAKSKKLPLRSGIAFMLTILRLRFRKRDQMRR